MKPLICITYLTSLLIPSISSSAATADRPLKLGEYSYLSADRGQTNKCVTVESSDCAKMKKICSDEFGENFYFTEGICSASTSNDGSFDSEALRSGALYHCCSEKKSKSKTPDPRGISLKDSPQLPSVLPFEEAAINTSASLSAQAYCDPEFYLTNMYTDYASNFIPTYRIMSLDHDLNGFIGYRNDDRSIYVVFRGSSSITNFIDDMNFFQVPYPYCEKCSVHKGFYSANAAVVKDITEEVLRLQKMFPSYDVVVTGHSLGAAVATLCAVDLIDANVQNVKLINFGSPRVGDIEAAEYISDRIFKKFRITNHKDVVPHLPLSVNFMHISGEWYEDENGLRACYGFEDSDCSYQWYLTSVSDHLQYLGFPMGVAGCTLRTLLPDQDATG